MATYPSFKSQFDKALEIRTGTLPVGQPSPLPVQAATPQTPSSTPTGLSSISTKPINSEQTPQGGTLVDFQRVMRSISQDEYESRQKTDKKAQKGQFDASKVSGNLFADIIGFTEKNRGGNISKMYAAGMEAGTEQMRMEEEKRQFDIEQDNKKWDTIKSKTELGVDSVYIPGGTLADKNNNPGNLRFVGQMGATQGEGGFARFETPEAGWQALISQVQLDQSRGLTLAQFVNKYAPPNENNTNLYVQQMSTWLGVDPNVPLSKIDATTLAENIAKKESGAKLVKAASDGNGIEALANKLKSGEMTVAQIPAAQRGQVVEYASKLGQVVTPDQKAILMNNVSIVDRILDGDQYENISGKMQTGIIPFTQGWKTSKEYEQLKSLLSLEKRELLKGQGAISDFEFKVLSKAASNISRWNSEDDFKQALIDIRGAFNTAAGNKTDVLIKKNGEELTMSLSRDEITDLIADGAIIKYL